MLQKTRMLKSENFVFFYISTTRGYKEYKMTNNIFARTSQKQSTNSIKSRKSETAETAGSLAMKSEKSYLAMNSYDTVSINSPYSLNIDFSNYSNNNFGSDSNSGFLSSFSNAVAVIGTDCSGVAGSGAGAASVSSGSCGGGFTSFV